MALLIRGTPNTLKRGILAEEVGVNIRRISVRYFPESDERIKNFVGETFIRSVSQHFSREISADAEIKSGTPVGLMAFTLGASLAFANDVAVFATAVSSGNIILDEAAVLDDRGGWRSVSIKASSNPGI